MAVRWLTTEELHERTGISPGTWRYWRHQGKGPAHQKIGRVIRYPEDQFEAWARAHLVVPVRA